MTLSAYSSSSHKAWRVLWASEAASEAEDLGIKIPFNSDARVYLPATNENKITANGKKLKRLQDMELVGEQDNQLIVKVGSGSFAFVID